MSYTNLGYKLMVADDHDLYDITGCLSSCNKSSYEIELSQQNEISNEDTKDNILQLFAGFPLSRYERREQVRVYP